MKRITSADRRRWNSTGAAAHLHASSGPREDDAYEREFWFNEKEYFSLCE